MVVGIVLLTLSADDNASALGGFASSMSYRVAMLRAAASSPTPPRCEPPWSLSPRGGDDPSGVLDGTQQSVVERDDDL